MSLCLLNLLIKEQHAQLNILNTYRIKDAQFIGFKKTFELQLCRKIVNIEPRQATYSHK